jgi:tetratricopeptide (TPR) repeat protein/serine/threonine protein kinase
MALKPFLAMAKTLILLVCFLCHLLAATASAKEFPDAVKIVAPDRLSVQIYSQPKIGSEVLAIALHDDVLEVSGEKDGYVEVRLANKRVGYVAKENTVPWQPPVRERPTALLIGLGVVAIAIGSVIVFFVIRKKRTQDAEKHAASIPAAIKQAEEFYRSGDYEHAIKAFNRYINLQGGEVRTPDVYRRLTVCYQKTEETREAAKAWEKMRSLGGLKGLEDYTVGAELMGALGREADACEIYEALLESQTDEDRRYEIHEKLFNTYRKLKEPKKLINHAIELEKFGTADSGVISDTARYLIAEGQTDLAIESNNKELITGVCAEFLDDRSKTPEAARIYLKCLEYDRTDARIHRILADIYSRGGDFRRAVSELTMLHQLDKDQSDEYIEEAARIYVENKRVQDALQEGNPLIIKKIAQTFLARSEVNPDAVAVYEKVLEFQPNAIGINKMLSTVYLTRGDLDKYVAKLRLLHEIDGDNQDYLTDLAQCVIDNDLIEQTIKEGNRALNAKILKQLIKKGVSNDKAIWLYEKLIKYEPDNAVIRGALATAYENRKEYGKSFQHLLILITQNPDDQELCRRAAAIAVDEGLLPQVLDHGGIALLVATALQIAEHKIEGPEAMEIMAEALTAKPDDDRILGYFKAMKPAATPAPVRAAKPEVASPPKSHGRQVTGQKAAARAVDAGLEPQKHELPSKPEEKPEPDELREEEFAPPGVESIESILEEFGQPRVPKPPRTSKPIVPIQTIDLTDEDVSFEEKAITTFVSGYSKRPVADFAREELFLPVSGSLAYQKMEILVRDGWGDLCVAVEVNTGRHYLMRLFRNDLLDAPILKDFVTQVTELGFNMVHENLLPILEVVTGPNGVTCLVHPFAATNLENLMKAERRADFSLRMKLIGKIMDGLVYAHNYKGVDGQLRRTYHLHLHPSCIALSDDFTQCYIVGVGYSQIFRNLSRGRQPRWQDPGMNPASMPPEFFRSKAGTVRERSADIYSLGVLIYYVATGEFPFDGPSLEDYKFQHNKIFAAPPRLIDPTVPDWLEPIILGCLEKDPEKRWDSIMDIRQALNRGMEGKV